MNNLSFVLLFLVCGSLSLPLNALENMANKADKDAQIITIETATIRGNQELPTVLYLVPWQPPEINPLDATQTADMTKHTIQLIDRSSFKRLIEYHDVR